MTRQTKRIEAKKIFRKKLAIVIEFTESDGYPVRFAIPENIGKELPDGKILLTEEEINIYGIPFGIPWEHLLESRQISSNTLAGELRKNGIWTREDVYKNPSGVRGALFAASSLSLTQINQIAKNSIPSEEK